VPNWRTRNPVPDFAHDSPITFAHFNSFMLFANM
jgi:hypothetical protein